MIVYEDYAFHALRFSLALRGADRGITHAFGVPTGGPPRRCFVFWREGAFDGDYRPRAIPRAARAFRERVMRDHDAMRPLRAFVTSGGAALCELWCGRAR